MIIYNEYKWWQQKYIMNCFLKFFLIRWSIAKHFIKFWLFTFILIYSRLIFTALPTLCSKQPMIENKACIFCLNFCDEEILITLFKLGLFFTSLLLLTQPFAGSALWQSSDDCRTGNLQRLSDLKHYLILVCEMLLFR